MSNQLIRKLVEYEKECCPKCYFGAREDWANERLREHLGVSKRCINSWRQRIRQGLEKCPQESSPQYPETLDDTVPEDRC